MTCCQFFSLGTAFGVGLMWTTKFTEINNGDEY